MMNAERAALLRAGVELLSRLLCEADDGATVTIPVAEHRRLVAYDRDAMLKADRLARPPSRSPVDRDPEVADFIVSRRIEGAILATIRDECLRRFGPDRSPSLSAIHRLIQRRARASPLAPAGLPTDP